LPPAKPKSKRTRSQAGKLARTKGARFEAEVATMLRERFPGAVTTRSQQAFGGRKQAPDVDGTPFFIECKVGAPAKNWRRAFAEAQEAQCDSGDLRTPILVFKEDYREAMVATTPACVAEWDGARVRYEELRISGPTFLVLVPLSDFVAHAKRLSDEIS
jgi:hypothetical protein